MQRPTSRRRRRTLQEFTLSRSAERPAQPEGGVLVDALGGSRSGATRDDVSAIAPERLHYAQICDGRVPGPPVIVEVPSESRAAKMGYTAWAKQAVAAARAVLEALP